MLNKVKKFNMIQRVSLVALLAVLLCQLGGMTWAWLTDHDEVENVFGFHDYYVDIVLTEPNWNSVGRTQAQRMQPGMDIYKDPRVTNITEDACYVRMQVIVADRYGNILNNLIDNETNGDQKTALEAKRDAIMGAIAYYNGSSDEFTSYNSDFAYSDGYYYYTKGGNECVALATGETTSPLFTDVQIPILKKDYVYFEDGFVITVKAEAVFSIEGEDTSVEAISQRFNNCNDDATSDSASSADTTSSTDENIDVLMVAYSDSGFGTDTVTAVKSSADGTSSTTTEFDVPEDVAVSTSSAEAEVE